MGESEQSLNISPILQRPNSENTMRVKTLLNLSDIRVHTNRQGQGVWGGGGLLLQIEGGPGGRGVQDRDWRGITVKYGQYSQGGGLRF
jgi:hypothetical protein